MSEIAISPKTILAIETSCDETSAAVMREGKLASVIVSSQFFHRSFGGVVPELASRAHLRAMVPIVNEALNAASCALRDVEAVAVTYAPGLMGALLVGTNYAKGVATALRVPFIGVHHLEAHIFSAMLETDHPELPFIALLVSGGHTMIVHVRDVGEYTVLGETLDDAAGEAFDKVGKMLGMRYPAGPEIDKLATEGNPDYVALPRSMMGEDQHDFSFSGIKTAVLYRLRDVPSDLESHRADIAASFQRAVIDVLVTKTLREARMYGARDIAAVGGVSANSELRARFKSVCENEGLRFFSPRPLYSTDNAAMIGMLGAMKLARGISDKLTLRALPRAPLAIT